MIFSDNVLSQKLERTEGRANASFVATRARLDAKIGASWIEVGGAYAMFDGVESPLTQTFGLGVFEETTSAHLDEIETFFKDRDAPVFHEVSPMAFPTLMPLLNERGYRPIELTSVMYKQMDVDEMEEARKNPDISTRIIDEGEAETWARLSASGWAADYEGLADFMFNFGKISTRCDGAFPYLAELRGEPVSTGMLFIFDDVCLLAGASTVPSARNMGAQSALLRARLSFAAEKGCKVAMMGASPGSQSQKNAQKNGFHIAYTRTKWQLFG